MAEPGFYVCRACGAHWRRMEFKLGPNPPPTCPHCKADSQRQDMDDQRERAYVHAVYGPLVAVMTSPARDMRKWAGNYLCIPCRRRHERVAAVVRAFAGEYHSGEGFPACAEHAPHEIELAMRTLVSSSINPAKWTVQVREVIADEHGYPKLGRVLFIARPRATALQGVALDVDVADETIH